MSISDERHLENKHSDNVADNSSMDTSKPDASSAGSQAGDEGSFASLAQAVLSLSTKMTLTQVAPLVMSFYVARIIGGLSPIAFASFSLVTVINTTVFITIMTGLQSLYFVSGRQLGTDNLPGYRHAIRAGVLVALVMALVSMIISACIGSLTGALGVESEVAERTLGLGYAAMLGMVPIYLMVIYRVHASILGHAGTVTLVYIAGTVIAILAVWLVADRWGYDDVLATELITLTVGASGWVMLFIAIATMLAKPVLRLATDPDWLKALLTPLKTIISMGWQISAVVFLDSFVFLFAALVVGRYWPEYLPVHSIAAFWVTIWLVLPLGLSLAAVQMVSVYDAKGNQVLRNRVAWVSLTLGAITGIVAIALFWGYSVGMGELLLGPAILEGINTSAARLLMPLAGVVVACQGMVVIAAAILRGLGQTRAPLIQAAIGYGVIGIGGQLLFSLVFDWDMAGIWWGLLVGFAVTTISVMYYCWRALSGRVQPQYVG